MAGDLLFGDVFEGGKASKRVSGDGPARVSRPDRHQSWLRPEILDELIPHNHRARAIVAAVEGLDLSAFYASIKSRGSEPGRPATDPTMLVALWLFATSEGVGSGRQLARLCERDDVYRWICGGVSVNYHTLTDFRVRQSAALDGLLTQLLAVLMHRRLVSLKRVAQDGVRVRANAGTSSFRRKASLQECLVEAKQQVARAKQLLDKDDPTRLDKQQAAVARAAREREDRVTAALDELKQLQAKQSAKSDSKAKPEAKSNGKAKEPRASTTDPEARVMRMGDGGYRPAFNIQFATDTESKVIVGVGVTNNGSDYGLIAPMLEEVERRTGEQLEEWLADDCYGGISRRSTSPA